MAEGRQIRVCVLEGHYVELADAGTPISVCLQMQQLELSLGKAQWSTRQTCGGFSVSFFWPTSPAKSARTSIKKRKRRRKRTKRTEVGTQCLAANPDAPTSGGLPSSEHVQDSEPVLINDHPASSNSKADSVNEESFSPELDLAAFRDVVFEEQESNPGVRYMSESGETTWTPVVNRRNRRRARLADPGSDSSDQRNELQSTIKSARDVTYQCREGVPGLKIRKGCTSSSISWVPIAATPVASRTRSRVRPQ